MDWTSLAVFVGLALTIGAALDFVVTSSKKEAYAAWIARRSQPGSRFGYNGSKVLDRIFGSGLMSRRALNRYALISLASIALSFAFAYATSAPEEIEENIRLFPKGASSLAIGILALCIGFAVVGDFISYSITRLFIRTVDEYRTPVVSLGLVVADIVVSLVLFFLVFSFARAISYLLVLTLGSVPALTSEKHFLPKVVQAELREAGIDAFDPALASARTLAGAVASANREPELSRAATVLQVREGAVNRYVSYRASVACFELDSGQDIFSAIADTSDLVAEVVAEMRARYKSLTLSLSRSVPKREACEPLLEAMNALSRY